MQRVSAGKEACTVWNEMLSRAWILGETELCTVPKQTVLISQKKDLNVLTAGCFLHEQEGSMLHLKADSLTHRVEPPREEPEIGHGQYIA